MIQTLILETSEHAFLEEMDSKLKEGFKVIAGSTYIKSLPTNIDLEHGTLTTDVEHIFSVAIRSGKDFMVLAKAMNTFRDEVNSTLNQLNHHILTGSLSIDLVNKSDYKHSDRVYMTFYGCALYKG